MMHNIFRLWGDSIQQQHTMYAQSRSSASRRLLNRLIASYAPLASVVIPWLDPRDLAEAVAHVTVAPSEEWAGKTVVVHAAQYWSADELVAEVSKVTGACLRK